jgi:hypothetical protein
VLLLHRPSRPEEADTLHLQKKMFKYRLSFVRLSNEPDRYVNELSRITVGGSIGLLAFQATCFFRGAEKLEN